MLPDLPMMSFNSGDLSDSPIRFSIIGHKSTTMSSSRKILLQKKTYRVLQSSSNSPAKLQALTCWEKQEFSEQPETLFSDGCHEFVKKFLDLTMMPFSLKENQLQFTGIYYDDGEGKLFNKTKSLANSEDLIMELVAYFEKINNNNYRDYSSPQFLQKSWRFSFVAMEIVILPDDDLKSWLPVPDNYLSDYLTMSENLHQFQMYWRRVAALIRVLGGGGAGDSAAQQCSICLEEMVLRGSVWEWIMLPCSHVYHEACIDVWGWKSQTCPYCRATFPGIQDEIQRVRSKLDHIKRLSHQPQPHSNREFTH